MSNKKIIVSNKDDLSKQFYRTYNPNYWLYKITSLKNLHDNYILLKTYIVQDIHETKLNEVEYKKMLRTEMHFLYFKIIETLFEIIFALLKHDNRDLWIALSFSNDKSTEYYSNCYYEIKNFTDLIKRQKLLSNQIHGISVLRWLFNFTFESEMTKEQWKIHNENIESILLIFATDFSNRDQYNAYKHSLRLWSQPFSLNIQSDVSKKQFTVMDSLDAVVYLGEREISNTNSKINMTTKPFNFENDYKKSMLAYELLNIMILTRKYNLLDDFKGKDIETLRFDSFDISNIKSDTEEFSITV